MHPGWFRLFPCLLGFLPWLALLANGAETSLPPGAIPLPGHKDIVYSAAWDPQGKTLVTGCFDKTLRVWDSQRGTLLRSLGGPGGSQGIILGVDISPDGRFIAAVGMDQTLRLWENPRLDPTRALSQPGGIAAAIMGDDPLTRIVCSPAGEWKRYKVAPPGQPPVPIQLEPMGDRKGWPSPLGKITGLVRLGNRHHAMTTDQGEILLTDSAGKWLKTWLAEETPITQVEPGWDGLVSLGTSGMIKSWKADPARDQIWPQSPGSAVRFLGKDADKALILPAVGQPGPAQWRRLPDGQPQHALSGSESARHGVAGQGHEGPLAALVFGESDWAVWSGPHKEEKLRLRAPGPIRSVGVASGGRLLIAIDGWGVQRWQAPVGEPPKAIPVEKATETARIMSDGRRLLLTSADGRLRSMEGVIPRVDREVSRPGQLTFATLSPDGLEFLAGLSDGGLTWNRRATGDAWQPGFKAHDQAVAGAIWHPLGRILTWDASGRLKAWKLPWDAGFKPGEPLSKIALPDGPGFVGGPLKGVLETDEGLLWSREGTGWQWSRFKDNATGAVPPGPAGDWAHVTVHGRRLFALAKDGRAYTLPDYRGAQPWDALTGGVGDARPLLVSMSHPDRAIVVSQRGQDHYADLFDLKDLSLVGRYGPWPDLRAAIAIPFSHKILTLRSTSAQFHWAHFEGRVPGLEGTGSIVSAGNTLLTLERNGRLIQTDLGENPPKSRDLASGIQGPIALSSSGKLGGWWSDGRWTMGELRPEALPVTVPMAQAPRIARFDLDEKRLACCDASGRALLFEVGSGAFLEGASPGRKVTDCLPLHTHQGWILSVENTQILSSWAMARKLPLPGDLATAGIAGAANPWAWNREGEIRALSVQDGKQDRAIARLAGGKSLAQSPHQRILAAATQSQVHFFTTEGKDLGDLTPGGEIHRVRFHPQRQWLLVEGDDWAAVYDTTRLTQPQQDEPPWRQLGKVLLPRERGPLSFAGQQDQALLVPVADGLFTWTIAQDQPLRSIGHPQGIDSVAFDPKGRWVATGCRDFKVRLWNLENGSQVREIPLSSKPRPGSNPVYALSFRPDGAALAVAGIDGAVRVFDPNSGQLQQDFKGVTDTSAPAGSTLAGHEDSVFALAWSANGQWLASAGADRTIRLWKPSEGKLVMALVDPQLKPGRPGGPKPAHPGWIHSLKFASPDSLVSAGAGPKGSGIIRTWKIPEGQLTSSLSMAQGPIQQVLPWPQQGKALIATGYRIRQGESEETVSFLAPWPLPKDWQPTPPSNPRKRD